MRGEHYYYTYIYIHTRKSVTILLKYGVLRYTCIKNTTVRYVAILNLLPFIMFMTSNAVIIASKILYVAVC